MGHAEPQDAQLVCFLTDWDSGHAKQGLSMQSTDVHCLLLGLAESLQLAARYYYCCRHTFCSFSHSAVTHLQLCRHLLAETLLPSPLLCPPLRIKSGGLFFNDLTSRF